MYNNAEILNLYKHTINYKKQQHKSKKLSAFMFVFVIMMPIVTFGAMKLYNQDFDQDYLSTVYSYYNPFYSPYYEMGDVAFTSNGYVFLVTKDLEFGYPVTFSKAEVENGQVNLEVSDNILIKAPEDGVVSKIGKTQNNVNYIKINHGGNVETIIENFEVMGLKEGAVVKKGKEIATAKLGDTVVFKVVADGVIVTDYELKDNVIEWTN